MASPGLRLLIRRGGHILEDMPGAKLNPWTRASKWPWRCWGPRLLRDLGGGPRVESRIQRVEWIRRKGRDLTAKTENLLAAYSAALLYTQSPTFQKS